jgi:hypothetical protein
MRRFRAALPALALVTVTTIAIGCSAGSGPNRSVLGSEFHDKVVAACARSVTVHTAMGTFPLSGFNPTKPDPAVLPSIAAFLQKDADRYAAFVSELTALGSPPSGATLWTAVLDGANQHATSALDQVSAAVSGDVTRFTKDFAAGGAAQVAFLAAINAAGVPECAPVDR